MAVVKFNNRKSSTDIRRINQLHRSINYICDPRKTRKDLIGGVGVNASNALQRMEVVKNFYGKPDGREYIHFCVSFSGKPNAQTVFEVATEISKYYRAFQVLYAVHLNTPNTHIHFIINTVCVLDGHKFSQSKSDLKDLKDYIDGIVCRYPDLYYSLEESEEIIEDEYDYISYGIYDEATDTYDLTDTIGDDEIPNIDSDENTDFYYEESEDGMLQLKVAEAESPLIEPMIFFPPTTKVLPSFIVPYDSEKFQAP